MTETKTRLRSVLIFPDLAALSNHAAEVFVSLSADAVRERRKFSVALSGGSTPQVLYRLLATPPYASRVDWSNVHVFWGDERCVPPTDEQSNYRMAYEELLSKVRIPSANVHRIHGEEDPAQGAKQYNGELREFFADVRGANGWTRFDLMLLGMGDDGHTASLFPNNPILDEHEHAARAVWVEKFGMWRITLTSVAINASRHVRFLVSGAGKANTLKEVLHGPSRPRELPAQIVRPVDGDIHWCVTQDAATALPTTP